MGRVHLYRSGFEHLKIRISKFVSDFDIRYSNFC